MKNVIEILREKKFEKKSGSKKDVIVWSMVILLLVWL